LGEAGLVDDAAFAEAWVENRRAFRPRGVAGLRAELRRKGVGTEQIDLALAGYDEMAAAHAALQPVIRRWKIDTWEEFRRRASGHLARRGFTFDTVSRVVRAVWRASRAESEALS
jgi:regulatory protein